MRPTSFIAIGAACLALLGGGCAGPSYKLGRGINNVTEFARMGEMRRSIEQANIWHGPDSAFTFGAIRGFNRSVARTFIGAGEIATFPVPTPSYDANYKKEFPVDNGDVYFAGPYRPDQLWTLKWLTEDPRYPMNYKPGHLADTMFATDTALGFSSGDVAPFVPGSRFHIFDF